MILGIDIGTSSISIVLCNGDGTQQKAWTLKNDSGIPGDRGRHLQDPKRIVALIMERYEEILQQHTVERIGVTCQMHGILYVDRQGMAVSPLYTWEDESGLYIAPSGKSYLEELNDAAGVQLAKGIAFGSLTHYYHTCTGTIPKNAVRFCSIGDYLVMRLTGAAEPKTHVSNAASFGLYDLQKHCFDVRAIDRAGMDISYYPQICIGKYPAGKTSAGALVSLAIGDNQASYLGSVEDIEGEILLNLGTGGQISCASDVLVEGMGIEMRPLTEESFLAVYTTHCGGRAYAALEKFYREVAALAGIDCESLYMKMNSIAQAAGNEEEVVVSPAFCGTRLQPESRCEIRNLTLENFTPGALVRGFMTGICRELYPFYERMRKERSFCRVVGSGNTIRKNTAMQRIAEEVFQLPLRLTAGSEEAALGAVRFACSMEK